MPETKPDFDPRFDPRFQPGYDPAVHAESEHRPRHSSAQMSAERDSGTERDSGAEQDARSSVPVFDAEHLAHGGALDQQEHETPDAAKTPPRSETALLLRNPFLWIILVLSVALLVWSWTSYESAVATSTNLFSSSFGDDEQTQAEYTKSQFILGFAPFCIAVGLLALSGIGFFAAATWRRDQVAAR